MDLFANIFFSLISFFLCSLTAIQLGKTKHFAYLEQRKNRFGSIDGVRGFLALSVFFHHFIITYYWKVEDKWERPPEALFQNFGKVGVAIFFMITGFLFFSKVISKERPVDWVKLYQSRIFRIYPLYLFTLLIITIIVFSNSNNQINVSALTLTKELIKWGVFLGGSLNDYVDTRTIIARVDWTLKYEWLFYLSLPFIFVLHKKLGRIGLSLLAIICLIGFFEPISIKYFSSEFLIYFGIGATISCFAPKFRNSIKSKDFEFSLVSLTLILAALLYPYTLDFFHILIISALFTFIAAGNTLFGIFSKRSSLVLGEISYSIYLLHGVFLYVVFSLLSPVSFDEYKINTFIYLMPVCSVLVILLSAITYVAIEKPFIELGKRVSLSKG